MIFIIIGVQLIALLMLIAKIHGNTELLEEESESMANIIATNQRTIIIFLLIEILIILSIIGYKYFNEIVYINLLQQRMQ